MYELSICPVMSLMSSRPSRSTRLRKARLRTSSGLLSRKACVWGDGGDICRDSPSPSRCLSVPLATVLESSPAPSGSRSFEGSSSQSKLATSVIMKKGAWYAKYNRVVVELLECSVPPSQTICLSLREKHAEHHAHHQAKDH